MRRKIKVAEVITRLDWGGAPDIVRLICSLLDSNKFDFRLITGASQNLSLPTQEFLRKYAKRIFYIPELKRKVNPLHEIIALVKLYAFFRKEKFDIVHTHTAKAGVLGRIAAKLAGAPKIIHTTHGHNFYGYFGRLQSRLTVWLERFLAFFTDRLIALTRLEKKDLIAYKVSQSKKVEIISSGLELDKFNGLDVDKDKKREEFSIEQDAILVGMIGRLEPIKGPEDLVEAAKRIIEKVKKVRFLTVGDGSLAERLKRRTKELGIEDKFIFTGWREDIPEILNILDLLILPSLNEAVGRVLIEAAACGVPVVATRVGGVPEIVKQAQTGILVPPQNSQALAEAAISLLEDAEKRKKMGAEAKTWASNGGFSSEQMVERISDLYVKLIEK